MSGYQRGLSPLTDPPRCEHGRTVRKAGYSRKSRSYFAAFFCPDDICPPQWVDVSAIISEALSVWTGFADAA